MSSANNTNAGGAMSSVMSPGKSARFSELVSIITSTARALQDEFDFLSPDAWNDILDQMFPGSADGKTNPSGMSREILTILENEAAREAKKLKESGKVPVFGNGSAPPAGTSACDISDEQRKIEWSLIVRYGDPRAPMSDEHLAGLRVALMRWWNWSPPLEVLRLARKATIAQFKLVGGFGPGMLPFNTAIWHKATYDGQCQYLDYLVKQGNAKGVTAMQAFLGKLPAPKALIKDDVVFIRERKVDPKTTAKTSKPMTQPTTKTSKPTTQPLTKTSKPMTQQTTQPTMKTAKPTTQLTSLVVPKKRSKPEPVQQIDSDSESEGPVFKRPRRQGARRAAIIESSDSSDDTDETTKQDRPSLIVKLKIGPPAVRPCTNAPPTEDGPSTARPQPVQSTTVKQVTSLPKKKFIYKHEAELTTNPRTNALISYLISSFYMKNKKVLARSPWALEKLRRYAQAKEPHIKGQGRTSMLEIAFFEDKDLSWSLTGFQLDRFTEIREEAKVEWLAKNEDNRAVDLTQDGSPVLASIETTETEKLPEVLGDAAVEVTANSEAESATPSDEEDPIDLFTTINDSPHPSADDSEDVAAANQLLTEQYQHQQHIHSSRSTTRSGSSNSISGASHSDQHTTYEPDNTDDDSSDNDSEWHDAVSSTEEM